MVSRRPLALLAVGVAAVLATIVVLATVTPPAAPAGDARQDVTVPADATGLDSVHAAGVTGENVTVGVVDVTGFDTDHPTLAGRVARGRSFAPGESVRNGGQNDHGTAAASLVARTAPDSDLYLASFDTAEGYEAAVEWLRSRDVDVIVAPVTFYGKPGDGSSTVAGAASRAVDSGVVFVAPTGNLARGHWTGTYHPVGAGIHRFETGTRNYLRPTGETRLRVWLSWDGPRAEEDYTAELYWTNGTDRRLVARSQPYPVDSVPNERIVARIDDGAYFLRVTGPPTATGTHLRLESPTHPLQLSTTRGSIAAPATARGVISVGAYDVEADRVALFSSGGPTRDGRVGVDLVAPADLPAATQPDGFAGSSSAAAYTAGTAALVIDAGGGDVSPQTVERTLEGTATDLRGREPYPTVGHGLLRPAEAIRTAGNRSNEN